MDYMEYLKIAMSIITILLGVIGFFVKKAFNDLDNKASKTDLEEVKKDVEANKESIGKIKDNYLTKEDFFREQTKMEKRLDEILKLLRDISKERK